MATSLKNLSTHDPASVPSGVDCKIGVVVAEWNEKITAALCEGTFHQLQKYGVKKEDIVIKTVPGTVELTYGAKCMAEHGSFDAVIVLGCVIKGETPHFDYVCTSVTKGITDLNVNYPIPFVFGVLTTNDQQQAIERSGGKHGNKGDEAAITALKMIAFNRSFKNL